MKPNAMVMIETLKCFSDARGVVVEPMGPQELSCQRNAHLVLTAPGGVRGNHYHRRGTEVFVLMGPALVRLREGQGNPIRDVLVDPGQVMRFLIPPGVTHSIQNTGQEPLVVLAFNTDAHDPQAPDVVRDVLIPT